MKNTQEKIIEILRQNTAIGTMNDDELLHSDFQTIGINSLNFIKIIVAVEETFGIEFNDDDLNYNTFKTVNDIVALIDETAGK